jgi:ABC-type transport system involved in multi-copper enzyme maturation permease subunit
VVKLLHWLLPSLVLSLAYLLPVTVVIIALSGNMAHWVVLLQYLFPLWGYIMVYAALGAAISVLARSTKAALIVSLECGLILMPRFFMLVVNGLSTVFQWTQATKDAVSLISPGAMMYVLAEHAGTAEYVKTLVIFSFGVVVFLAIAFIAFCKQDELNYGE